MQSVLDEVGSYLGGTEKTPMVFQRLAGPGLGFGSFWTAQRMLVGYETMAMIRKGQVQNIGGSDIRAQVEFIAGLFKVAA